MKRLSVLLSTVLLLAVLLAGCGGGTSTTNNSANSDSANSGVITLNYWVPFSGGDGDFMKAMVDKFNQSQQGIRVTMLNTPSAEYYTKLRTAIAANQGPDVAVVHTSRMPEFLPNNALESLDEVASEAGIDWNSFNQNLLKETVSENRHYAIPLDTHAQIMFYNKAILREAGLLDANDKPAISPGPDGFLNYLREIKAKVPADVMPFATTSTTNQPFWGWWSLYSQTGGKLLNEDGTQAAFNNENGLKALQLLETMVTEGLWPRNIANGGEIFIAGKAALSFNGVWYVGTAEKTQGLDFGVMPVPQIFDQPAVWGDSHTIAVPTQATDDRAKLVAAAKFANWLADNGAMWAQAGHVPSKPAVIQSQEFQGLTHRKDYVELADYVSFLPTHPKTAAISDMMKANFNLMMNGESTGEAVLAKSEQDANALLTE